MAVTPNRAVRIPDERWDRAQKRADVEQCTRSEIVNRALEQYLATPTP